jgi:Na+-driven multidrug efflux pump
VRVYFLGDLPKEWGVNIASQLAWVNLGLEVIQEVIILPLFYLIGKTLLNRETTINKLKTGLFITFFVYMIVAILISIFAETLVTAMSQADDQIPTTIEYIRLEMVAGTLYNSVRFLMIFFILMDWRRVIYYVLGIQVATSILLDMFLLSEFDFSYRLGVNGIAYSNMVASLVSLLYSLWAVHTRYSLSKAEWFNSPSLSWIKDWWAVGRWSGVDSLIRNSFFLIFIIRMINVVEEQGTFWVANNFIWGWLLLPFLPLSDLIKQDTAQGESLPHWEKMIGYFFVCGAIVCIWLIALPGFGWFFENVFNADAKPHVDLVILALPFYFFFMINTSMDSVLYGCGKTSYLALQSLITNVTVYGSAYLLFLQGFLTPSLEGIVVLFGIGILVDTLVTIWFYNRHLKAVGYRI